MTRLPDTARARLEARGVTVVREWEDGGRAFIRVATTLPGSGAVTYERSDPPERTPAQRVDRIFAVLFPPEDAPVMLGRVELGPARFATAGDRRGLGAAVGGMDAMLDAVAWQAVPPPGPTENPALAGLPHVTHAGVLELGGHALTVYRLSDGRRIVAEESMRDLLAALPAIP